ncbi:non-hydrolyzing UDP-N-acetylglucosamine 2-epimerase [Sandarakinorhabdus sp.]|uniref:non-hydrolyzing UDP-N-acetylglucosamine 2-epimerase n=1 Tax=Sandarakinorhabdus sp. TaxID=1916663 RepID=UPI00286DA23C|nr:UDP-N-acetylglucosamine 2-epimerase (non-hydrolyzing) [Sandarakinorhabdus sp.]
MIRSPLTGAHAPGPAPILFIAGTRPEAVKLAPLIIDQHANGLFPLLVATGQQREMLAQALAAFGLVPDHDLDIMDHGQTPDAVVGRLVPALAGLFRELRPGAVVVQGDTASAFAGAIAASYARLPLAHVEAGLRTGGGEPFPEEMHRKAIAQMAGLHLAPTPAAAAALAREGIAGDSVHITGNSGIDALHLMQQRLADDAGLRARTIVQFAEVDTTRPWLLATVHRRENHGRRLEQVLEALAVLARDAEVLLPVHPHPAVSGPVRARLSGLRHVHLLPPLDYASFVWAMARSALVLTDSGGIQEEAPALGLPVLVLRDSTERREGLGTGNALLVGTDTGPIIAAARRLIADSAARAVMAGPSLPYGQGDSARRINALLLGLADGRPAVPSWQQNPESWSQSAVHHRQ